MNNQRIISLKNDLTETEYQLDELAGKVSVKKRNRVLGILGLVFGFLLVLVSDGDNDDLLLFGLLLFLAGSIFLLLGVLRNVGVGKKQAAAKERIRQLKRELVSLEHES